MKVLLHADGGHGVGLGHLMRCTALASQLIRQGHSALIAVDPSLELSEHLMGQGVGKVSCAATSEAIRGLAMAIEADCVVIDTKRWTAADFFAAMGRWSLVAFDDEAVREFPVDAVINGAVAAAELHYHTPANTRLLLGPDYQIVRDDFRMTPSREHIGAVNRVIALVGGDDLLGLLPVLARLLEAAAANRSFAADVICGPFTLMPILKGLEHVTILRNPSDLCDRMAKADLAISASGQTLYELARCGTPTIAFCAGPDQIHNLAALERANVVWSVGDACNPDWSWNVSDAITELIGDVALRLAMSKAGQTLIDGLGVERLVREIESLRLKPKV